MTDKTVPKYCSPSISVTFRLEKQKYIMIKVKFSMEEYATGFNLISKGGTGRWI